MRLLFAISFLLLIASCQTPQELFDSGITKIEKAIDRDPNLAFPTDTIRVTEYDTIPGADGKDSLIIQTNTIKVPCDFTLKDLQDLKSKTSRELRYEKRMAKDSLRHIEKMYKLETNRLQDSLNALKKLNKEITKRLDDANNAAVKLAKEDTKQQKGSWFQRQMGKIWWLLLIIGLVAGLFIRSWIPKIPNPFKQKQDG